MPCRTRRPAPRYGNSSVGPIGIVGRFPALRQVEEVLVLADDDHIVRGRVCPDLLVVGGRQPDVEHVNGLVPLPDKKPRQCVGELVADEEFHDCWSTMWSVCRAAYAIAATMSSRSRKA